jgi:hypothetical protein
MSFVPTIATKPSPVDSTSMSSQRWDLDDGRAPNVRGELHLVMSSRDWGSFHFNSIYFKHYELTDARDKTKI